MRGGIIAIIGIWVILIWGSILVKPLVPLILGAGMLGTITIIKENKRN